MICWAGTNPWNELMVFLGARVKGEHLAKCMGFSPHGSAVDQTLE